MLSIFVGDYISLSVYDNLLVLAKLPYWPILRNDECQKLTAGDVMVPLVPEACQPTKLAGDDLYIPPDTVFPVIPRCTSCREHKRILYTPVEPFNRTLIIVDSLENMLLLGSVNRREL